jgi:MPBQ/MSBQ methyltransferase
MRQNYPAATRRSIPVVHSPYRKQASRAPANALRELNSWYDYAMYTRGAQEQFGGSDFHNYGYWQPDTLNHREACENLVHVMLALVPDKGNALLDVACGKGASTKLISQRFPSLRLTAINISEKQLRSCKNNAPAAAVVAMDAAHLGFQDNSFDTLVCVEAALHFRTREMFLKEAFRILRPGGFLVLSDVLASMLYESKLALRTPRNYLRDPNEYRNLCVRIGFEDVQMIDATDECFISFYRRQLRTIHRRLLAGKLSMAQFRAARRILLFKAAHITYYVLVCVRKPQAPSVNSAIA